MKRTLYVSSAAAAVLLVGGPVAAAGAAAADAGRALPAVSTAARASVDAEGAAAAALKHYPGVIESLDKDGSTWHVNIIGKNGTYAEVEVGSDGKATTRGTERNDDDRNENAALVGAKVNAQKAITAALAAHPGTVWSVNWDDDDNDGSSQKRYWDVQIKSGDGRTQNVHVDPTSGKATVSPSDSDEDEDGDDSDQNGSYENYDSR
ncbi:PepSY domain-containing protein [Streptomyces sp. NPDC048340]|uniref:PepSY domain-containing protein n=1 Tax=Streptomyces sp. NPDC048340 TaxID=3365537 RepID=UPI003719FD80